MNIYQVDAFNNQFFKGNPAAVIPLKEWISDALMQNISEENNLSETVFFVKKGDHFEIRWFTPTCEIDLCGHATLAAAHIIYTELNFKDTTLVFESKSGPLKVTMENDWYTLNFPSEPVLPIKTPPLLEEALQATIIGCYKGKWKLMVEIESAEVLRKLTPNFNLLCELPFSGIIVTAKSNTVDFESRFFAPEIGINEDPVTGSAHTLLIPFWSEKLSKNNLKAIQVSKREGILNCSNLDERVEMSGQAVTYLKGELLL